MSKKPSFEELRKVWYKKLRASGFEDIETPSGMLASYGQEALGYRPTAEKMQDAEQYYYLVNCFLNEHQFDSERDAVIWFYYANGISYRNIAELINDACGYKIKKSAVAYIVKRLKNQMFKKYFPSMQK